MQKWIGEDGMAIETPLHLSGARVVKALNAGRVLVATADAVSIWDIAPSGRSNAPLAPAT